MAQMVWCNACKKVVWASDDWPQTNLSGICNMFQLACPKCGARSRYDGWGFNTLDDEIVDYLKSRTAQPIYDYWSALKAYAKHQDLEWDPSPDNVWR